MPKLHDPTLVARATTLRDELTTLIEVLGASTRPSRRHRDARRRLREILGENEAPRLRTNKRAAALTIGRMHFQWIYERLLPPAQRLHEFLSPFFDKGQPKLGKAFVREALYEFIESDTAVGTLLKVLDYKFTLPMLEEAGTTKPSDWLATHLAATFGRRLRTAKKLMSPRLKHGQTIRRPV